MNHKEVLEIKKRFSKKKCTLDRVCGCYVGADKEIIAKFGHSFLSLEDEEFFKYLEIVKKCLSGKLDNNLMNLEFSTENEMNGEEHKVLMALRDSKLKDDSLLDAFYNHIIENFDYDSNYVIFLFHDTYDVPLKTTDNIKLDDSEEVYEYIVGAICPVDLSKPGLSYKAENEDIRARERDWVVGAVNTGFLFPAFNDRSTDIHSALCYTKNAKEPHTEFWEKGLSVGSKLTSIQKRELFEDIVESGDIESVSTADILLGIQKSISDIIIEKENLGEDSNVTLEKEMLIEFMKDSGASNDCADAFIKKYDATFKNDEIKAKDIVDDRIIQNNMLRLENKALREKVAKLTKMLSDMGVKEV